MHACIVVWNLHGKYYSWCHCDVRDLFPVNCGLQSADVAHRKNQVWFHSSVVNRSSNARKAFWDGGRNFPLSFPCMLTHHESPGGYSLQWPLRGALGLSTSCSNFLKKLLQFSQKVAQKLLQNSKSCSKVAPKSKSCSKVAFNFLV